jgi:hypothetical protein
MPVIDGGGAQRSLVSPMNPKSDDATILIRSVLGMLNEGTIELHTTENRFGAPASG